MSGKNHNRTNRLEKRAGQHHDASTRVLSAEDRYGYTCARLLDMAVPEALERKFKAWKAIQVKQGNTFTVPQAARDGLIKHRSTATEEEAAAREARMRGRAEATIAKYA